MEFAKALAKARKEQGMTQEQLAARVYVTRQAVSRWETGESTPGVDMRKLLATSLGIPVTQLLDLPSDPVCQCCGTPFSVQDMPKGTEADGTENPDYCKWCYEDGHFTSSGLDELIERNAPYLLAATGYTKDEAVSFLGALLPNLKRWQEAKNENRSGNARRSMLYACPDCGNVAWSMGRLSLSCCGNPLEPLVARPADGALKARVQVIDGSQVVTVEHPMTKDDHLSFIAAVGTDLVRIQRLYAQQEALARFPLQGPCKIFAYGSQLGLVELS